VSTRAQYRLFCCINCLYCHLQSRVKYQCLLVSSGVYARSSHCNTQRLMRCLLCYTARYACTHRLESVQHLKSNFPHFVPTKAPAAAQLTRHPSLALARHNHSNSGSTTSALTSTTAPTTAAAAAVAVAAATGSSRGSTSSSASSGSLQDIIRQRSASAPDLPAPVLNMARKTLATAAAALDTDNDSTDAAAAAADSDAQ
jgi:hypothetical protein